MQLSALILLTGYAAMKLETKYFKALATVSGSKCLKV
jgi:hypothetical protein